jgi:hypothetical protein
MIARVSYQGTPVNVKPQGNGSDAPSRSGSHERRPYIWATVGLYIAWLTAAVLLVSAAIGRHPYSFYTLLRWICCPIFAYSAFAAHEKNRVLWVWVFGTLAALYNPLFRVHLDRSTWIGVNWFTVVAIVVAAVFFWRARSNTA